MTLAIFEIDFFLRKHENLFLLQKSPFITFSYDNDEINVFYDRDTSLYSKGIKWLKAKHLGSDSS